LTATGSLFHFSNLFAKSSQYAGGSAISFGGRSGSGGTGGGTVTDQQLQKRAKLTEE